MIFSVFQSFIEQNKTKQLNFAFSSLFVLLFEMEFEKNEQVFYKFNLYIRLTQKKTLKSIESIHSIILFIIL